MKLILQNERHAKDRDIFLFHKLLKKVKKTGITTVERAVLMEINLRIILEG